MTDRAARAARAFGEARDVVDQAIADKLGINRTDLRLLGVVQTDGPVSAGRLAGRVGLSPAATTEAVQRLVARGLLARATDDTDRRRAVITLTSPAVALFEQSYGPVRAAGLELIGRYTTAELEVITDFLEKGRALQLAQSNRIRANRLLPSDGGGDAA